MAFTPSGMYAADQQGLFGTQPTGPSFQDYIYSQGNVGYGIQSQYLTPNYAAGYRPAYGGPTGEPNPYQNPQGQINSAWYAAQMLPIPGAGFGSQVDYSRNAPGVTQYHAHNLVSIGPDASANILQQYIAPIGAAYYGAKIANYAPFFASGAKRGLQTAVGMGVRETIGARAGSIAGRTVGAGIGAAMGGTTRALFGLGSVTGGAAAVGAAGSFAGALAGSVAAPLLLGQGLYNLADKTMFDPYVQTRRGAEAMLSNNYGMAMGGSAGSVSGGLGMSASRAYEISSSVNKASFSDFAFKDADYTAMMDYAQQAGLFDSMSGGDYNAKNVTKKVREISKDVKQIMQVFGEKDTREAIGILAKFSKMGFGPGTAEFTSAASSVYGASAYTGKSAQAITEGIFTPGAYAFQSKGMNGVLGGRAATDAYRGYEAAVKNGLVSKSVIASLGGTEGATQLQTSAMLGLAGTQYNMMSAYNQYFSGNKARGISGNLTAFAKGMGTDPMRAVGNMALYGNQLLDKQMGEDRFAPAMQAIDILKMMRPGQKNAADLAAVLTGSLGLSNDQARAMILDMQSTMQANPGELTRNLATQNIISRLEAENMTFANPQILEAVRLGYTGVKNLVSTPGDYINKGIAKAGDALTTFMGYQQTGLIDSRMSGKRIGLALSSQGELSVNRYSASGSNSSDSASVASYVNKYAQSLDPKVRRLANKAIKNGSVDVDAMSDLQNATGDTSLSVNAIFAAQKEGDVFSNNPLSLGSNDIAARVAVFEKSLGFAKGEASLASEYDKIKDDPIKLRKFEEENADKIRRLALQDIGKKEIRRSGAFANDSLSFLEGFVGETLAYNWFMKDEQAKERVKSLKPGDRAFSDLTKGVVARSNRKLFSSFEGQVTDAYYNKGAKAATAVAAGGPGKIGDTGNSEFNRQGLNGIGDAGVSGSVALDLNQALSGIDFQTGLNLNDAIAGSQNTFDKAGAMLLKGANIIAATAEAEARRKGGSLMAAPATNTPLINTELDVLIDQGKAKAYSAIKGFFE